MPDLTSRLEKIRQRWIHDLMPEDFVRYPEIAAEESHGDVLWLLEYIDVLTTKLETLRRDQTSLISHERSDERSNTLDDVHKYLAEGLRKLGLEARDTISLTEVLSLIESQQKTINELKEN